MSLHERALAIREEVLGPDHGAVGSSLNNLAVVMEKLVRSSTLVEIQPMGRALLAHCPFSTRIVLGTVVAAVQRQGLSFTIIKEY